MSIRARLKEAAARGIIVPFEARAKQPKKLSQAVVLYMPGKVLGSNVGAHCGDCWKFVGSEAGPTGSCIEVEGDINGPHGVCGLYCNGRIFDGKKPDFSITKVSKEVAGYIEDGPTHCGSCEYFNGPGDCDKVENFPKPIEATGCCNRWDEDK